MVFSLLGTPTFPVNVILTVLTMGFKEELIKLAVSQYFSDYGKKYNFTRNRKRLITDKAMLKNLISNLKSPIFKMEKKPER